MHFLGTFSRDTQRLPFDPVDMLAYAIDNPAPATIVLISGDRDFVYAVSVLRLRRYRVVLVAPNSAHASLKSQASSVLDWETDIMRKAGMRTRTLEARSASDEATPRSPRRPGMALGSPIAQFSHKSSRRLSFKGGPGPVTPDTPLSKSNGCLPYLSSEGTLHLRTPSIVTTDDPFYPDPPILSHYRAPSAGDALSGIGPKTRVGDQISYLGPIQDIIEAMQNAGQSNRKSASTAVRVCTSWTLVECPSTS